MPVALRVEGPLDAAVLALCLGEIVRRHEALRTVFAARGRRAGAGDPAGGSLSRCPWSICRGCRRPRARRRLSSWPAKRPAARSISRAVRCCAACCCGSPRATTSLALTLHHIASDGWSMGVLVREVAALYPAFAAGRPSPLPELPVQYADFAVWQRSWLQRRGPGARDRLLARSSSPACRRSWSCPPTGRGRRCRASAAPSRPVRLPAGLARQAEALGRREGATLFMVLLAGFQALLARISGQDDLAVGSPIAGRNRVETEGLIGFFVNTLVLRGDLAGAPIVPRAARPGARDGARRLRCTRTCRSRSWSRSWRRSGASRTRPCSR